MVDAPALGAGGVTRGGSSPLSGTNETHFQYVFSVRDVAACRPLTDTFCVGNLLYLGQQSWPGIVRKQCNIFACWRKIS